LGGSEQSERIASAIKIKYNNRFAVIIPYLPVKLLFYRRTWNFKKPEPSFFKNSLPTREIFKKETLKTVHPQIVLCYTIQGKTRA